MGAFENIITPEMKTLFTDAIDALLEDDACMVPCTLVYEGTKWEDCPNCIFSPTTGASSNQYQSGGPMPFYTGSCPYCGGRGRIEQEQTETIYLMPIWDYSSWIGWNASAANTRYPDGAVQTMSKLNTLAKIKKTNEIIIATDAQKYTEHRMTRDGEPNICGFGASSYIFTIWKHMK